MDIRFAVLADMANIDGAGKLNIIGVFSELNSATFPVSMPSIALAAEIVGSVAEVGSPRELEVAVHDADGERLGSVASEFTVPEPRRPGKRPTLSVVLTIRDMQFPRDGDYQFALLLNGDEKYSLPLHVRDVGEGAKQR